MDQLGPRCGDGRLYLSMVLRLGTVIRWLEDLGTGRSTRRPHTVPPVSPTKRDQDMPSKNVISKCISWSSLPAWEYYDSTRTIVIHRHHQRDAMSWCSGLFSPLSAICRGRVSWLMTAATQARLSDLHKP